MSNKSKANLLARYATPFAAGALLAAAFTDLLPEASHEGNIETALKWVMIGILIFFVLERFLHWFHHHHDHEGNSKKMDPTVSLVVIGDTVHNFIDGIAIAAAFLVSPTAGIISTIAVAAHEIPQEIGDFGLLLKKGMSRANVIKVNILSALATVLAATVFFSIGRNADLPFDIMLGLVAGFFVYIAASDIIPSIHESEEESFASFQTAMLIAGAVVVSLATASLHKYIDQGENGQDHSIIEGDYHKELDEHHDEHDIDHSHD